MRALRMRSLTLMSVTVAGVALIASATTAAAGPLASPVRAASVLTVTGGSTTTVSTPELGKALLGDGIVPLPVGKAKLKSLDLKTLSTTITMPIVGGTLDPAAFLAGSINHSGGLQFISVKTFRSVTISDFVVVNDASPHLVATVNKDPKQQVSLFKVDLSALKLTGSTGQLGLGNVGLLVTDEGAALLNSKLKTKVFKTGMKFGTADTTVLYK